MSNKRLKNSTLKSLAAKPSSKTSSRKASKIANPLYDTIFKVLMANEECAKLLLSEILQQEILGLHLEPQEVAAKVKPTKEVWTAWRILKRRGHPPPKELYFPKMCRLDFKALLKTAVGDSRVVLIEIQRLPVPYQTQRFRKYLGSQYMAPANRD